MSELNYDLFLVPRNPSREADANKATRLRAMEWRNPSGGAKRTPGTHPQQGGQPAQSVSRRSLPSIQPQSPSTRAAKEGSGTRLGSGSNFQASLSGSSSGAYPYSSYNLSSANLPTPSAPSGPSGDRLVERHGASLGEYFDLITSSSSLGDASFPPVARERPRRANSIDTTNSGMLLRRTSRESTTDTRIPPWLAHLSSGSVLSDGDDDEPDQGKTEDLHIKLAPRDVPRTYLDSFLSFLLDTETVGGDQAVSPATHSRDSVVQADMDADGALIRLNTFSPLPSESDEDDDTKDTKSTRAAAADSATEGRSNEGHFSASLLPSPMARRRRSQQLVTFKTQMVEVMSVDPSPRTIGCSQVLFRNPTIRELGREMQRRPAQVRRYLVRDRPNAVHTVVILDEDAVDTPLLVACGTHVRVYPALTSREEYVPSVTSSKRRSSSGRRPKRGELTPESSSTQTAFGDYDRSVEVDEAVSRPSGSTQYTSVTLDEAQDAWLNGRNTCLILGASKARNVGMAAVAQQFLASAATELSLALREEAGEGSWFEMRLSMGEVFDIEDANGERSCEVRDLLAASTAQATRPAADVHITTSAFFGPSVVGLIEETVKDGTPCAFQSTVAKAFIQYIKDSHTWYEEHGRSQNLTQPVCFAQVHLKTVRSGEKQAPKVSTAAQRQSSAKTEVFLSSLLIVFAGTSPVTLVSLTNSIDSGPRLPRVRRDWQTSEAFLTALTRSAIGGHTRTAVCACLSDCDPDVTIDWLEALTHVRHVRNEPPLTGNVRAFLRCLQAVVDTYVKDADKATSPVATSASNVNTERLMLKIQQLRKFLRDPKLPTPKLSMQAVTLMVN